jgi:hypothetical protein
VDGGDASEARGRVATAAMRDAAALWHWHQQKGKEEGDNGDVIRPSP